MKRARKSAVWVFSLTSLALVNVAGAQPLQAGEVVTWGGAGGLTPVPPGPFEKIAAGTAHALAIRPDGSVVGWGIDIKGQASAPPGPFIEVAAGGHEFHGESVGIRPDGSVEHWGYPFWFNTPPPAGPFVQVSVHNHYALLRRDDGSLATWGAAPFASPPPGPFKSVAAGWHYGVAIHDDGSLVAFGQDPLGVGILNRPPGKFKAVAAGHNHAVAIRTDGTLIAWGNNAFGQLDVPAGTFAAVAVPPNAGAAPWGFPHWTIGLRTDGSLVAWGNVQSSGLANAPPGRFVAVGGGEFGFGIALAGCYADCDDSGTLTVADFSCFQSRFVGTSPYADCTGEGRLTVADFVCFQTQFAGGCS